MDFIQVGSECILPPSFDELARDNPQLVEQFRRLSGGDYCPNIILYGRPLQEAAAFGKLDAVNAFIAARNRTMSLAVKTYEIAAKRYSRSPFHLYLSAGVRESEQVCAFEKIIKPCLTDKTLFLAGMLYIVIDDVDQCDGIFLQKMLLRVIEKQHSVAFIFITNKIEKMTDALRSRCLTMRHRAAPSGSAAVGDVETLCETIKRLATAKRLITRKMLGSLRKQINMVQKELTVQDSMLQVVARLNEPTLTPIMLETQSFETFVYGVLAALCG